MSASRLCQLRGVHTRMHTGENQCTIIISNVMHKINERNKEMDSQLHICVKNNV